MAERRWAAIQYLHRDYRYVFYDDQAVLVGYLIFAPAGEDPLDIHVTDLDYVDENALMGILSFLSGSLCAGKECNAENATQSEILSISAQCGPGKASICNA